MMDRALQIEVEVWVIGGVFRGLRAEKSMPQPEGLAWRRLRFALLVNA
jgi:hypothetical protein